MSRKNIVIKLEESARDRYNFLLPEDSALIPEVKTKRFFNKNTDRIETVVFSLDGTILNVESNNPRFKTTPGDSLDGIELREVKLFPEQDAVRNGFNSGDVEVLYNFYRNVFTDTKEEIQFFIKEVSPDRTELILLPVDLPSEEINEGVQKYKSEKQGNTSFQEILLRFTDSNVHSIVNLDSILVDGDIGVKVKLYVPLDSSRGQKDIVTLVEPLSDGVIYRIEEEVEISDTEELLNAIKGPNFSVKSSEPDTPSTDLLSLSDLLAQENGNTENLLFQKIRENNVNLGINYKDPEEFINFSSYRNRLEVFNNKKDLLDVESDESKKQKIVENFDHFEKYLFEEEVNVDGYLINQAEIYDRENQNRLINSIPNFIKEDPRNQAYLLFVDMIGNTFDNIWIYTRALQERYNTDNRLEIGLSKDLIKEAVKSFGYKINEDSTSLDLLFKNYQHQKDFLEDEFSIEHEDKQIQEETSKQDYIQEVYKRVYHNIPVLLKSKGTEKGIKTLINCFGIPTDLINIKVNRLTGKVSETVTNGSKDRINIVSGSSLGSTLSLESSIKENNNSVDTTENGLEIGFSPSYILDKELIENNPNLNLDDILGDPRFRYNNNYPELDRVQKENFENKEINVKAFLRLLEFYTNSVFEDLLQLVDGTIQTTTGFIIKPNLLNRNKQPETRVSIGSTKKDNPEEENISDLEYLLDFLIKGEITIGDIQAGDGGAFSRIDKPGIVDKYTTGFIENIPLPKGGFSDIYEVKEGEELREYPKYNGEFKGSQLEVTNSELNEQNPFKRHNFINFEFDISTIVKEPVDCKMQFGFSTLSI